MYWLSWFQCQDGDAVSVVTLWFRQSSRIEDSISRHRLRKPVAVSLAICVEPIFVHLNRIILQRVKI